MEAVLFDLDGTLLDTEGFQWQSWVEALKPLGVELSREEYISEYAGKNGPIQEEEIMRNHGLDEKEGVLLEKKEQTILQWFRTKHIDLLHYAQESVDFFISRNLKVGVVSSGPKDEILLKLKRTGLGDRFEVIVSRGMFPGESPTRTCTPLGQKGLG